MTRTTRPDSVALESSTEIEVAGFVRRLIAFAFDGALAVGVVRLFDDVASILPLSSDDWWWIGFAAGFFFPIVVPVFVVLLLPFAVAAAGWVGRGQTPGKILAGVAIRDDDVGHVHAGFRQLFRRERSRGWRILLVIPALVDHLAAVTEPGGRTRHDLVAGTIVVCARAPHPILRLLASSLTFAVLFLGAIAGALGLGLALMLLVT